MFTADSFVLYICRTSAQPLLLSNISFIIYISNLNGFSTRWSQLNWMAHKAMETDERPKFVTRIAFNFQYGNMVILIIQNIAGEKTSHIRWKCECQYGCWSLARRFREHRKFRLFLTMTQPGDMCAPKFKQKFHIYQSQRFGLLMERCILQSFSSNCSDIHFQFPFYGIFSSVLIIIYSEMKR